MADPVVLAFDTSAAHCAAALLSGGRTLTRVEEMAKGQAERLVPMLEELLAEGGLSWRDVGLIAVGVGPGNFTGVRISVALARGLALGLGVPAIGVTGFEAAAQAAGRAGWVVIGANRGQSYLQDVPGGAAQVVDDSAIQGLEAVRRADIAADAFVAAIAAVALDRRETAQPRPAPFYLRGPDAALPSEPPPVILPDLA